jgi:hypothetical protein
MGYCHYWERHREFDQVAFSTLVFDFQRCVLALDDMGVRLAGPLGEGLPEIGPELVAINGLKNCGHAKNEEICIPFPAIDASGIGPSANAAVSPYFIGVQVKHRTCDGRCDYETFTFERITSLSAKSEPDQAWHFDSCKTAFRPYDLAVQCFLLIAKHHLPDQIRVYSGGSDFHWNDARLVCYLYLGYPLTEFRIDKEAGLIQQPGSED